jgi:predicted O-methyltransferase YrrM
MTNLKLAMRYPDVALAFLTGGRLGAFKKGIRVILRQMDKLSCDELTGELKRDLDRGQISFSGSLRPFEAYRRLAIGVLLYKIVRVLRPANVVETGVCLGKTSSFILGALRANNSGKLYSIDLGLPCFEYAGHKDTTGGKDIGWLVPRECREAWTLCIGDSRDKLPDLLDRLGSIDLFLHDSEHSYDLMMYEYCTAWPYVRDGGFLVSDDVHLNNAFPEFATAVGSEAHLLDGEVGAIRKDPGSKAPLRPH